MIKILFFIVLILGTIYVVAIFCRESGADMKRTIKTTIPLESKYPIFEDLLDAIEWVESKGDPNAVGDEGAAVGNFQIHKIYVDDVNRIKKLKHNYRYAPPIQYEYFHRNSPYSSRYMVKCYLEYYATAKRIGREPTFEDMARIHNGGPNGWKKVCTKPYWVKVKKRLYE